MTATKDYHLAMSVQQMAAYGYFNEEFIFYCFAFERDGQIVYKLSDSLLNIYSAYQTSIFDDIYPTPVHTLLKSAPVPAGESTTYRTRYKMELIQTLRECYDPIYYDAIRLFAQTPPRDEAMPLLKQYLQLHLLETEQRQLFDGLCQQALEAKQLSREAYQQLMNDANRLYGPMSAITQPIKGRGKLFSGFAYWSPREPQIAFYQSATLEETYVKYDWLRREGMTCTPIIQKSYWYTSPNDLKKIKAAYRDFLTAMLQSEQTRQIVDQLKALPPVVERRHYQMLMERLEEQANPVAVTAFLGYGHRFHLHSLV